MKGIFDDSVFVLETNEAQFRKAPRPLGMFKSEEFIADGYDIDEDNDEIARMFGVTE